MLRYRVREDIQKLVLLNRWKSGVCAACFDELAEKGGIAYSFDDLQALSWSDRGAPRHIDHMTIVNQPAEINQVQIANHAIEWPRAGIERIGGTMRPPSAKPHATPNVLLLLTGALGMWAVVIVTTVSAWPRQHAAPKGSPSEHS